MIPTTAATSGAARHRRPARRHRCAHAGRRPARVPAAVVRRARRPRSSARRPPHGSAPPPPVGRRRHRARSGSAPTRRPATGRSAPAGPRGPPGSGAGRRWRAAPLVAAVVGIMSAPHRPPADATTRFTDRVDAYVRARPDYPVAVIELLRTYAGLGPGTVVADVGAGTGILTRMFARTGATVHAVEPNGPMLAALIAELDPSSTVRTHRRPAEATNLSDASIDLI